MLPADWVRVPELAPRPPARWPTGRRRPRVLPRWHICSTTSAYRPGRPRRERTKGRDPLPVDTRPRHRSCFFRVAIHIKPASQIMLVSLHIFRPAFFRRLHLRLNSRFRCRIRSAIGELTFQLSDDGLGELGLNGEHVLQIARVVFRPLCSPVSA